MTDSGTSTADEKAPGGVVAGIFKSLRPHQWVKNVFVLAPAFFSMSFLEPALMATSLLAALLFSLSAGSVYLFNDIFDVEKDRNHPVKRNRPIASGQLPINLAIVCAVVLAVGSVGVGVLIQPLLGAVLGGYLVMNLAYSSRLKHVAFVDVAIIATGFVLRVVAGAFAIEVYISEWLFACTFLLALYLGLGKRAHELALVTSGQATKVRKVLEKYKSEHLDFAFLYTAGATIACYTVYTLTASLPDQPLRRTATPFDSEWLPLTIPFTIFGIVRFYQLVQHDSPDSPTDLMLRDWPFLLNVVGWGACLGALLFV